MKGDGWIIDFNSPIVVTGSNGFIGSRVVETLLQYGFKNLHCFVRPASNLDSLNKIINSYDKSKIEIVKGNLQSRDDCQRIMGNISVIYHLAAGRGQKSYPDAYLNSVITTRNILDTVKENKKIKRFVNVSSLTVYSNEHLKSGGLLDETCPMEDRPELRGEAYCYAKVRQDEVVIEYGKKFNIPFVLVRPGAVYGPGNPGLTGRVGIGTFGLFFHLGGSNRIPLSYVDNCAEAIVLAGLTKGVDGEIFNIIDDDLPTSRKFLRMYKDNVKYFKSIYIPHRISYFLCYLWERYSEWSEGQLPPVFNRKRWSIDWKGNKYSNEKLKKLLAWKPKVNFEKASSLFFESEKKLRGANA